MVRKTDFQWYYKRNGKRHLTKRAKEYLSAKLSNISYFINFEIDDTRGYVVGSLSSPYYITLKDGKEIIKRTLENFNSNWKAIEFYEAQEKGKETETLFVLMREDDEIYSEVLKNV